MNAETEYKGLPIPVGTICPWCRLPIEPSETIRWDADAPEKQKAVHRDCWDARKAKS